MTKFISSPGMIHLIDGPGEGRKIPVQRAPVMLRFVSDINGKWDVLDMPEDTPTREEEIHVYRQITWAHIRADKHENSGFHYRYAHVPLDGTHKATLRFIKSWRAWAQLQVTESS